MRRSKSHAMLFTLLLAGCALVLAVGEHDILHAQSLVGVWECPGVPTPWGPAYGKTILMPDGTFTKTAKCGDMQTWDKGTYTVGKGYVHYKILDHEPKVYKGKPMSWFKEETTFYKFVGPDRILCGSSMDGLHVECYRAR